MVEDLYMYTICVRRCKQTALPPRIEGKRLDYGHNVDTTKSLLLSQFLFLRDFVTASSATL